MNLNLRILRRIEPSLWPVLRKKLARATEMKRHERDPEGSRAYNRDWMRRYRRAS
jgi:hypothetical protein